MKILSEFQSVKEHQNFIITLTKEKRPLVWESTTYQQLCIGFAKHAYIGISTFLKGNIWVGERIIHSHFE